jgi:Domain of unknown function DUF302
VIPSEPQEHAAMGVPEFTVEVFQNEYLPAGLAAAKEIKLFAVIDQAAEARQAGLDLRDTTLVMFGSPAAGPLVMAASPLAALDLPLKVLVWDDAGQTKVSYNAPAWLTHWEPQPPRGDICATPTLRAGTRPAAVQPPSHRRTQHARAG